MLTTEPTVDTLHSPIAKLPTELLGQVISLVSLTDLVKCDSVSKSFSKVVRSVQTVWRYHCICEYRFWNPKHSFSQRVHDPALATDWRELLIRRKANDRYLQETLTSLIENQAGRLRKVDALVNHQHDAKDFLLQQLDSPEDREDYLARTCWAGEVLSHIHRRIALRTWTALRDSSARVTLEQAMACVDLFIADRPPETPDQVDEHLDRIAERFLEEVIPQDNAARSTRPKAAGLTPREKALLLASFLRKHNLTGLGDKNVSKFDDLQNSLIGVALCDRNHPSLPLLSTVIYCAVARRVGVYAYPINYPGTIHAIVSPELGSGTDLDGEGVIHPPLLDPWDESYYLYLNPYSSDKAVPYSDLYNAIQSRVHPRYLMRCLAPCKYPPEMLERTANNIYQTNEVTQENLRTALTEPDYESGFIPPSVLDKHGYVHPTDLGGNHVPVYASNMLKIIIAPRLDHMPREIKHFAFQALFDQILNPQTINEILFPLVASDADDRAELESHYENFMFDSDIPPVPKRRARVHETSNDPSEDPVYHVGTYFVHRKYNYEGIVIGWDPQCAQNESWIRRMRVDDLDRKRYQPFYNVVDASGKERYVAEDNIQPLGKWQGGENDEPVVPPRQMMKFAGKFMRRWDAKKEIFVSNMKQEYPDD